MISRAKAYLIPYLVFFVINLMVYTMLQAIQSIGTSAKAEIAGAISRYILAGLYSHDTNMPNCAPLWFLTCLFITYFYFWFLMKSKSKIRRILMVVLYLGILFFVNQLESVYGIEQLPWHIDVALIASVFMLIGYELKKLSRCFLQSKYRILICTVCFIAGSVIAFFNKRVIMVTNQYGNMISFLVGATAMSVVVYDFSMRLCSARDRVSIRFAKLFGFWGRNTLMFIGFNYMINLAVRQLMKIFNLEATYVYSIVDIICVMIGCSAIAYLWNWIHGKISRSPMKSAAN